MAPGSAMIAGRGCANAAAAPACVRLRGMSTTAATATPSVSGFTFDNTYARELEGFYVAWKPAVAPAPSLVYFDDALAADLGLDVTHLDDEARAQLFSGNALPAGAQPLAQAYAGHQFGGFSPQLGDGRALLVGEVIDRHGERRDIAFKGSGRTPFARGGDGKAALGPMLREVVVSQSMHALRIPTTRALAVVATGAPVYREGALPGAVLTRVAASHLRVGTFQFFAARADVDRLRKLADYAIGRHYPELASTKQPLIELVRAVCERQAALVAQWMNVGFIHGVMNTDNMTISGETIDYGPCAFMEAYDPATVFSSIDERGRYAYANQPAIAQWNLARFAETLIPLLGDDRERAIAAVSEPVIAFEQRYAEHLLRGQRAKLGLRAQSPDDDDADRALAADWLTLLQVDRVDYTLAWRYLADAAEGNEAALRALFPEPAAPDRWLARWRERVAHDDAHAGARTPAERANAMRDVNPLVIARNHRVEEALAAATGGDLAPLRALLAVVRTPYASDASHVAYAQPAPADVTARYRTFCGT